MSTDLIQRLSDEADLCRNDGATDIAGLLDEAQAALEQQAAEIALRRGERMRLESELFDARTRMADQAAQIAEKDAEIARLTECLSKANANHEHFERAWYLRGDEVEALRADAERLIHERDHERAHREAAANMLVRIHALLNPPSVVADGSVYRFDNPNATDVLQLLSDRIRDVPHRLAAIDAALRQEQPNE